MSTLKQHARPLLREEDFKDHNIKVRVNIYIDLDIIKALKQDAHQKKIGYQTLLNQKLREVVLGQENLENRVVRIEKHLRLVK